jgi:hypothetical protein
VKPTTTLGAALIIGAGACGIGWALLPSFQGDNRAVASEAGLHLERARRLLHQYDAELSYQGSLLDQLRDAGIEADASALSERERIFNRNDQLLDRASQAIDEAMAVRAGDASGRDLPGVLRIQGAIQFYRGMADRTRAAVRRLNAEPLQDELRKLAGQATESQAQQSLVAESGIVDQIALIQEQVAKAEQAVADLRRQLTSWDHSIADIEQRIVAASALREQASGELRRLREQGIDFSIHDAAKQYAQAYMAADRAFREADRQVQYLTTGYFPRAEIDASGDFYTGRYLENGSPFGLTVEPGLTHFQNERAAVAAALAQREAEVADLSKTVERLNLLRERFAREESDARDALRGIHQRAAEVYADWNRIDSEAAALEETALAQLERAVRSAREASTQAGRWVSDAQTRLQNLPPATTERSAFNLRRDDTWMGGYILAEAADARLASAWVYYDRYRAATRAAELLDYAVPLLKLSEADPSAELTKAEEAREAGVEEIKQAMADLQRAHRDVERHWTVIAQAAGTQYLLALFGDTSYVSDVVETYRSAVQGREDASHAEPFVRRLRQLETGR